MLLGLVLVAAGLVTTAGSATAEPTGPGMNIRPPGHGDVWLGALAPPPGSGTGELLWCIQGRMMPPNASSVVVASSAVDDPVLAAAVAAHQHVETVEMRAALSYLVHTRHQIPGTMVGGDAAEAARLISQGTPDAIKDLAASVISGAAANAGPYAGASPVVQTGDGRTGRVDGIALLSAAGTPQAGKPFTLTLEGPAVWDETGTNELRGTTGAQALSFGWTATGNGLVTYRASFGDLGRVTLTRMAFSGAVQEVLTYGNRSAGDPEFVDGPPAEFEVVRDFQPEITTRVASTFVAKGDPMVDIVTAAAAAGDQWATVGGAPVALVARGTLYGPYASQPAESATVPDGAPVVGSETLTFAGPSTQHSPGTLSATGSGYYTWVWEFDKEAQAPDVRPYVRASFAHPFGQVVETSIVPFAFQVRTEVADTVVEKGDRFVDRVTAEPVAGDLWLHHADGSPVELSATGTLYGPFVAQPAESAVAPADAPVVATETLVFSGPGTLDSPGETVATSSGYYTWVWEIRSAEQPVRSQPYITGDFVDTFGLVAETHVVPFQPEAVTERADRVVDDGTPLVDHVTASVVEGDLWLEARGAGPVGVMFEGTAYGPFLRPSEEGGQIPAGAPVAGTERLTFSAPGTQTTAGEVLATGPGFYTWVWRVVVDDQPADLQDYVADDWSDDFMIPIETSTVLHQVEHLSVAREYNVVPGGRAFDTIRITGMAPDHGEFEGLAEWVPDVQTATVRAYGPVVEVPSGAEVPEGTPVLWEGTVEARNGVFHVGYDDDHPVSPTEPGHYVFVYSVEGDDRVEAYTSRFDDVLERFYVPGMPEVELPVQVVTQATPTAVVGEPFGDTALVTGTVPDGAYLVFEAFGPQDPDEVPVCEAAFFTSERVEVPGPGYYASGDTTVDRPGAVYWVESLYSSDDELLHRGECGIPSETTLVTEAPAEPVVEEAADVLVDLPGPVPSDDVPVPDPAPAGVLAATGAGVAALVLGAALLLIGVLAALAARRRGGPTS